MDTRPEMKQMVAPHIKSFNFFLSDWLKYLPKYFAHKKVANKKGNIFSVKLESLSISRPSNKDDSAQSKILPSECRVAKTSYSGEFKVTVRLKIDDQDEKMLAFSCGDIPIMSKNCHLNYLTRAQLVAKGEEEGELGGYFIVKGAERIIRLLQLQRRNVFLCTERHSHAKRGSGFSHFSVKMRSVREDLVGNNLHLHYLRNGDARLAFKIQKFEYQISPILILKCLKEVTDMEIFMRIMEDVGEKDKRFFERAAEAMLRWSSKSGVYSKMETLDHFGSKFNREFEVGLFSDSEIAKIILERNLFVHCYSNEQKFDVLISMIKRVLLLANKSIEPDSLDSLSSNEVMLPGQIYASIVSEALETAINRACYLFTKMPITKISYENVYEFFRNTGMLRRRLESFLSTGNISNYLSLQVSQTSGFTISTERINYMRFISHFRSIHKGQLFLSIQSTDPRKLMPDCWGFICPVHTPDGGLCGLLSHLASQCDVTTEQISHKDFKKYVEIFIEQGLISVRKNTSKQISNPIEVNFNGKIIGSIESENAKAFISKIRKLKVEEKISPLLEIIPILPEMVPKKKSEIYLSLESSQFTRKVFNKTLGKIESIGVYEQIFLDIAICKEEAKEGFSHYELSKGCTLSSLASLTPFSDFNQSPRNMYQCQMAKQSMGTPYLNENGRSDEKSYFLQSPQNPVVKNKGYDKFGYNEYPSGTNAIVCVISFTGYDMEDAAIINKSAYERGFSHGRIVKSETEEIRSTELSKMRESKELFYPSNPINPYMGVREAPSLDLDGLPQIGQWIKEGEPKFTIHEETTGITKSYRSKSSEPYQVKDIRMIGGRDSLSVTCKQEFSRKLRLGDKFSSRHGQKGTLSQLWPASDMPFSKGGMVPDILINPHAFPSRMTIGMFIESMAGKVGSEEGKEIDGSPFQDFNGETAAEHFGRRLKRLGYDSFGNETMYSGLTGEKIEAEVFIGVVYYQRLRHMILDKAQVRALGPSNRMTRQPVKGRKNKGGIRVGEMERDSLLSHGCSFVLMDRMLNCSDHFIAIACKKCHAIISAHKTRQSIVNNTSSPEDYICRTCNGTENCVAVNVPFCLIYLINELASVNIKLRLKTGI